MDEALGRLAAERSRRDVREEPDEGGVRARQDGELDRVSVLWHHRAHREVRIRAPVVRGLLLLLVACAHPVAPVAGAPEVIVAHAHPRAFALADGVVIWSTVNEHTSSILVTPRHGGASRTLVEGIPVVRALVVHDMFVYFATEDRIGRIPIKGGVPETLVEGPATDLAVTDTALIWIDADLGLATTPLLGGEPRVLLASQDRK